ncbi:hypothetical protein FA95DRAFT_1578311 [Auriscalpium vulgare]|uniref:Uncharacterized protein n=1 Tax=Auriscalpium vulgare TaxID=40419 RepID=A0ACB8R2A9_9AGAM|nr:hypothetical protein FA95DRAFT_1578311 [Auriscalpium vulgare]
MAQDSAHIRFRAEPIAPVPASHHCLTPDYVEHQYSNHMHNPRTKFKAQGTGNHTPTQTMVQSQLVNPMHQLRLGTPGLATAVTAELGEHGQIHNDKIFDILFTPESFIQEDAREGLAEIVKTLDEAGYFINEGGEGGEPTEPTAPLTDKQQRLQELQKNYNKNEKSLASYLDEIGNGIGEIGGLPSPRLFSAILSGEAAKGASEKFKPDIAAVRRELVDKFRYWHESEVLVEITKKQANAGLSKTMMEKMALKFRTQFGLRHVIGIGIHDKKITAYYMDRCGLVMATRLMTSELLVRIVGTLLFAPVEHLGRDLTIGLTIKMSTASIMMGGVQFEFVRYLHQDLSVRGRGLSMALVKHRNVYFVIRDFWADVSREITGAGVLRECEEAGATGVLRLLGSEVVPVGDNTVTSAIQAIRDGRDGRVEVREHRRELLGPMCRPLHSFHSIAELVQSLMDVTEGLEDLRSLGYIHREVTLANLAIADPNHMDTVKRFKPQVPGDTALNMDMEPEGAFVPAAASAHHAPREPACGVIVDVDHVMHVEREDSIAIADAPRPETIAFMAMELIEKPETTPSEKHDLESLFWILIWLCSTYNGEKGPRLVGQEQVWSWSKPAISRKQRMAIVLNKQGALGRGYAGVTADFAPEFKCLEPLACRLYDILFPEGSQSRSTWQVSLSYVTHADFITAFQDTLDELHGTPALSPALSALDLEMVVDEEITANESSNRRRSYDEAFASPRPFVPIPVPAHIADAGSIVGEGLRCRTVIGSTGETLRLVDPSGDVPDSPVPRKRARKEKEPGKYVHFYDKEPGAAEAAEVAEVAEAAEAAEEAEARETPLETARSQLSIIEDTIQVMQGETDAVEVQYLTGHMGSITVEDMLRLKNRIRKAIADIEKLAEEEGGDEGEDLSEEEYEDEYSDYENDVDVDVRFKSSYDRTGAPSDLRVTKT